MCVSVYTNLILRSPPFAGVSKDERLGSDGLILRDAGCAGSSG